MGTHMGNSFKITIFGESTAAIAYDRPLSPGVGCDFGRDSVRCRRAPSGAFSPSGRRGNPEVLSGISRKTTGPHMRVLPIGPHSCDYGDLAYTPAAGDYPPICDCGCNVYGARALLGASRTAVFGGRCAAAPQL